jgi:hypothetical protein
VAEINRRSIHAAPLPCRCMRHPTIAWAVSMRSRPA